MFIRLAQELVSQQGLTPSDAINRVFRYRPVDLLLYLERFWATAPDLLSRNYADDDVWRRVLAEPFSVGNPPNVASDPRPQDPQALAIPDPNRFTDAAGQKVPPVWKHIIYAYAVENTRVLEILKRVLREIVIGERLGRSNEVVLSWARNTEELFFTDRLGHWIFSPVSRLRDDAGAIRRNAYWRMLGMDLNHGTEDSRPYQYPKPDAANREFSRAFEQLLRETWRGYTNRNNETGPNLTDDASLLDRARSLHDMLRDRRIYGMLAREEFYCVATLSWFHLTVSRDNAVVVWLNAQGNNAAERLRAIGERVGLGPHTKAYDFFQMADSLSDIVSRIENGDFDNLGAVQQLYDNTTNITETMLTIINHWSAATGRNLKEFLGAPVLGRT